MSRKLEKLAIRNLYKPGQRLPCLGKPFVLRDKVGAKKPEKGEASCLGEMSVMMDCWKLNKFDNSICTTEIQAFEKCVQTVRANKGNKVVALGSKEVSELLRKNPLPRS